MIGLDTNIVLRLIVPDDSLQTDAVRRYLEKHCSPRDPGLINFVVLAETAWVLDSLYNYHRQKIHDAILQLLGNPNIVFQDNELVIAAVATFSNSNIEFADILIGEIDRDFGCETTATFDRKAAKMDGFTLVR